MGDVPSPHRVRKLTLAYACFMKLTKVDSNYHKLSQSQLHCRLCYWSKTSQEIQRWRKPSKSYVVFLSPSLGFPLGVYFTKTTVFGPLIRYLRFLRSKWLLSVLPRFCWGYEPQKITLPPSSVRHLTGVNRFRRQEFA